MCFGSKDEKDDAPAPRPAQSSPRGSQSGQRPGSTEKRVQSQQDTSYQNQNQTQDRDLDPQGGASSRPPAVNGASLSDDFAPPPGPPPGHHQNQTQRADDFAPPDGPPPAHLTNGGYVPPPGPPPGHQMTNTTADFAPPSGPPPQEVYAAPDGPPPGHGTAPIAGYPLPAGQPETFDAPPGPPPPHMVQGNGAYAPPPGPPPPGAAAGEFLPPSGPPPGHEFAPPSGPPPQQTQAGNEYMYAPPPGAPPAAGDDQYAPPPGPPPADSGDSKQQQHNWQMAVPDTTLFPPPPSFFSGFDRSPATNATESEAEAGEEWCAQYPLMQPMPLPPPALEALRTHNINLMQPQGFLGTLAPSQASASVWEGRTHANSRDSCIIGYPPLYSAVAHSPLVTGQSFKMYYEVNIRSDSVLPNEVNLALGFTALPYPSFRMPGWHRGSLAVHGDDGHKYINDRWGGKSFTEPMRAGQTVGIGMTLSASPAGDGTINVDIFFTRDGKLVGGWNLHEESDAEQDLPVTGLEGYHDLSCAVGTYKQNSFEIVFDPAKWKYREL